MNSKTHSRPCGIAVLGVSAVLAACLLTGCAGQSSSGKASGATNRATPSPSAPAVGTTAATGRNGKTKGSVARIAAGYTGKVFVGHLAATWHVSLRSTTGKSGTPQAGLTVTYGSERLPSGTEIEISALRDHTGALMRILCRVHGTDPATAAFFADCAAIDAPGLRPAAQASWAKAATASVRRSYSAAVGAANSAPYQAGNLTGSISEAATVAKGTTYTRPEMDLLIYGRSG